MSPCPTNCERKYRCTNQAQVATDGTAANPCWSARSVQFPNLAFQQGNANLIFSRTCADYSSLINCLRSRSRKNRQWWRSCPTTLATGQVDSPEYDRLQP